jgi:AcrR family transcriptional regulator
MTSRVRKRLSAGERRAKILSAATRAFAQDGYDKASMDRIAAWAEITKPVLYDHFSSKRELFRAVLESIRDGLIAKGRWIAQDDANPQQKFRRAVDAFFRFVEQEPDAARVLLTVPAADAVAAQLSRAVQAGASAGIAAMLGTLMQPSDEWKVRATAEFLKEGLHALAIWWLENQGPARGELVDIVMRVTWPGLEKGP